MSLFGSDVPFHWNCPVCARDVIVSKSSVAQQSTYLAATMSLEGHHIKVTTLLIVCPNKTCSASYVATQATWGTIDRTGTFTRFSPTEKIGAGEYVFAPSSAAPLSQHVPIAVKEDYTEAYLIRTMSPKASATLSRRALQGMIRDRWGVTKSTLHEEIVAIRGHCDPELHDAMMALKSIGNIGAHPEKDAAVIVDIEEGEADELLDLLKLLDNEWYIARAKRQSTIDAVKALNAQKQATRKAV